MEAKTANMVDVQILDTPLDVMFCQNFVADFSAGGLVTFTGTVRNTTKNKKVKSLFFEAYTPMAIKEMNKIAAHALREFGLVKFCMHHRIGSLSLGEIAVVIAVSAPHRAMAFKACQYAIDTLKETVPIWKKEIFESGEVWVAAHP